MKSVWVCLLASLIFTGCSSAPKPQAEVATPTFDWSPSSTAAPASVGLNFGVVAGTYTKKNMPVLQQFPFDRFASNMGADFVELLTAKGFTTTGPFPSLNEMAYGDKKGCDLVIVPELDVAPAIPTASMERHVSILGSDYFTFNGTVQVRGRVTLSVLESLSGTRMWNKSVEIPQTTVPFVGQTRFGVGTYPAGPKTSDFDWSDQGLLNAVSPPLEKAYLDILGKAWTYLDPEEMKTVKAQAAEVRAKTTFQSK